MEITQSFMVSWHQRQFLYFLTTRQSEISISPESEAVKPHWGQIEDLKRQGLITILDIVGTVRKDIKLTSTGINLVTALREQERLHRP